jgi:hypothetical protein
MTAKKVKSVEEVVDRAVKGMAEQDTVDRVLALKPGLHVRRTRVLPDGDFVYSTVRVVGCDRGHGMEYKIFTLNHLDGCEELELTQFEIESSYFMEIKENE